MAPRARAFWTNESVVAFAAGRDPIEAVVERARIVALEAMEEGWSGPPFNPFELASRLGVEVTAHEDLRDARLRTDERGRPILEYNPSRPRGRLRFSIAHELAHTFFTDYAEVERFRSGPSEAADLWQLELLCDVAAAELLMPVGSFTQLEDAPLSIELLMELRREFDVSTEALLLRVAKLTARPMAVFAASRRNGTDASSEFRIDYTIASRAGWTGGLTRGQTISAKTPLGDCTAIGFTSKGRLALDQPVRVECVGIPPYPDDSLPRVAGFVVGRNDVGEAQHIEEVFGDATEPRGEGTRMIVHLANDRTPNWGGMFAKALKAKYPQTQRDFREWVTEDRKRLRLGNVRFLEIDPHLWVATMVAQHGFGRPDIPRVRYAVLRDTLQEVAETATELRASVHMPRIGSGGGGGDWFVIRELVREILADHDVDVTIYAPPETKPREPAQQAIRFD